MSQDLEKVRSANKPTAPTPPKSASSAKQSPAPSGARQEKKEVSLPPRVPEIPRRPAPEDSAGLRVAEEQKAPVTPDTEAHQEESLDTARDEKSLSEILRTARRRIEEGEQKPKIKQIGPEPQPATSLPEADKQAGPPPIPPREDLGGKSMLPKSLADILPIEPFDSAQGKPPESGHSAELSRSPGGKPFDSAGGKPSIPSPETGEKQERLPVPSVPSKPASPSESEAGPEKQGVAATPPNLPTGLPVEELPASKIEQEKDVPGKPGVKTPEEILGLPASPKLQRGEPMRETQGEPAAPTPSDKPAEDRKEVPGHKDLEALFKKPTQSPALPARLAEDGESRRAGERKSLIRRGSGVRFSLIVGVLGLVLAAVGGGIYWNFFLRTSVVPTPPTPPSLPKPIEPAVPQALMGYDKIEAIEIGRATYNTVKTQIDRLLSSEFLPDTLVYVPVKSSTDTEIKYLTLAELLTVLEINAPPIFYTSNFQDFSLFLYAPAEEEKEVCSDAGIVDVSCYGPRMGLVVKISDRDSTFSFMREWEEILVDNLAPLMLGVPPTEAGRTFSLGKYGDFTTHFINLPVSPTSVDWILTRSHLIIATSKNAARRAVDRLR